MSQQKQEVKVQKFLKYVYVELIQVKKLDFYMFPAKKIYY